MLSSKYQSSKKAETMCFTASEYTEKAPASSLPRRRLTLNVHGTEAISSLKRALNLGLFLTPTVIHLQGDGISEGRDIYLSAAIQRSLRKLFDELRRNEPTLSHEKFTNFLETEQGEARDKTSQMPTRDTYKFEQFLEVWWIHFGLAIEKPVSISDKDLTKPLSNYFIDSSHNTYLPGNQLSGKASTETYKRALRQGCRCVEIDVWDNNLPPTTSKSVAGSTRSMSRSEHARTFSSTSLHTAAAYIKGAVDDKIGQTRQFLGVEKVHSRSPRCSKFNTADLVPKDASEPEDLPVVDDTSRANFEPIVMHGWTFNQPIGFRQVCKAIREVAFETTNLPIIISLEVHAGPEQQESMVQIMKQEWAGLLVEKPEEACPIGRMPRLEDLLGKILVKVKKASPSQETSTSLGSLAPKITVDDDSAEVSSVLSDDRSAKRPQLKVPICENLSNLAVYTHSEHFTNFESPAAKISSHIFSISENKILDLWESKQKELFAHNRNFFMRVYPKPMRIDSSNLDPSQFWRKGVQMAAMNRQSWDEGMMLNKAMFSGENGWVLKPPRFRSHVEETDHPDPRPLYHTFDLIITVLAGQHIPLPGDMSRRGASTLRPLVKCQLHVDKVEERSENSGEGGTKPRPVEWKQQTASGKTDHPEFDRDRRTLFFSGVHRVEEQLSFVRFRVEHEQFVLKSRSECFAGWACIRLDRLATGYRLIPLLDPEGNETKGVLLVKVLKNYR
ncbi:PLC-like phosphodiesterase [Xylaria sp. CBS 124048]|nr:PLC-like phosphodiesterase [Xylaria sp. CBS 124048]